MGFNRLHPSPPQKYPAPRNIENQKHVQSSLEILGSVKGLQASLGVAVTELRSRPF